MIYTPTPTERASWLKAHREHVGFTIGGFLRRFPANSKAEGQAKYNAYSTMLHDEWVEEQEPDLRAANFICPACRQQVTKLPLVVRDVKACPHCRTVWASITNVTYDSGGGLY